ncbi:INO80 complex subunit Ies4-domain-containing protein [Lipomyces orientalis]|uniref:INO80 complex subunit Ies4-domain-containing protein n=1 Tax=Lipomyces orientalis TaxID=1233043 RepID=A0ACC3TXF3_9ASCO
MSRQSRSVVLKINPQLLARQEQSLATSAAISNASSPLPPSSPLAPPTPPPGISSDIGTGAAKRKFGGAAGSRKKKKRTDTPSSPFLAPSDPPTRPLSALSGSPAPFDSAISSVPGTNGASTPTAFSAQLPSHHAPHAKLGPKANQGSINAQLRALDRSGRPCRRWTKIPLELRSFTGWEWSVVTWYGGPKESLAKSAIDANEKDGKKSNVSSDSIETKKDESGPSMPSAPPAPPPLTITIPSLNTVSGRSKDSSKGDELSKKGSQRFPAILLRQSLDEFEV